MTDIVHGVDVARTENRKIVWFDAEDAQELQTSGVMSPADLAPEVTEKLGGSPLLYGTAARLLFSDDASGFSLVHAWFGEDFPLPRHTHSSDCLYYVLRGRIRMGSKVVGTGEGLFVPANRPYTYRACSGGAEVLEFRSVNSFDQKILDQDAAKWQSFHETSVTMKDEWVRTQPEWVKPFIAELITAMTGVEQ